MGPLVDMWKQVTWLVVVAGCVPNPPPTWGGQPGGYGAPPPETAAQPVGSTCIAIVECLAGCGEDTACFPACIASGDEAAQAAVNALLACNAANGSDGCDAELTTCRGATVVAADQPPPPPEAALPPGQPHTTADLLPWMTGQWIGSNHQFTFYGDGRVRRAGAIAMTYQSPGGRTHDRGCVLTLNDEGTVTQDGDFLIMVFETADTNHCGDKSATAGVTVRYQIEWIDNAYDNDPGLQLRLRDIDCQGGDMYCLDSLTRR